MTVQKKMIFNILNQQAWAYGAGFRYVASFSLVLLFMSPLNAQESVNSNEKNDKIAIDAPLQPHSAKPAPPPSLLKEEVTVTNGVKYYTLYAEQWEISRSGESILSLPVLNKMINAWLDNRLKKIEIQYPGGEEGELWVHELVDWLVSLGIPLDRMIIVPGSGADDVINFALH